MTSIHFSGITRTSHLKGSIEDEMVKKRAEGKPAAVVGFYNPGKATIETFLLDETDAERVIRIEKDTYQFSQNESEGNPECLSPEYYTVMQAAGKKILDIIRSGLPVGEDLAVDEAREICMTVGHTDMSPPDMGLIFINPVENASKH
jgi:hypothetical protein